MSHYLNRNQENYLNVVPRFARIGVQHNVDTELQHLDAVATAAESISDGDLVDKLIHSGQHWDLQNIHGVLSTVRPASIMKGNMQGMLQFPSWLGKNSTTSKNYRLLRELQHHMSTVASGDKTEIREFYLPILKKLLVTPLVQLGNVCRAIMELTSTRTAYQMSSV